MSGPKNVIDMRPGKGFTTSQSNEHLRRMADKESAKKAQWNYDPSRERLNFEIGKGGVVKVRRESEVAQSCPTLATPWTAAYEAPLSMGFSRQKYWSGVSWNSNSL